MSLIYRITTESFYNLDIGFYTSGGISAYEIKDGVPFLIRKFSDISTNLDMVHTLIDTLNSNNIDLTQAEYIIEDYIYNN